MPEALRSEEDGNCSVRLDRLLSRTRRTMLLLEAAGLAAGVAGVWILFGLLPAAVAGGSCIVWLARLREPRVAAREVERSSPEIDRALSAWVEGGGGALRGRLAGWILDRDPRAKLLRSWTVAFAGLAVSIAAVFVPRGKALSLAEKSRTSVVAASPHLDIRASVVPPSYTGRPPIDNVSPGAEILRGSTLRFSIATGSPNVEIQEEGRPAVVAPVASGRAAREIIASSSRSIRFSAGGASPVVWPLRVVADAPPSVDLLAPSADLAVNTAPGPIDVRAAARDDIGLAALSIRWTLAHGRGESMAFRNGRAKSAEPSGSAASIDARIDPKALGMAIGDTLVVWAEATDGNTVDGPGRGTSPARIVRWEENLAKLEIPKSGDPFRLADGLLSEREILARTLRLLARPGVKSVRERASRELAADQRQLREAFSQFTQGESGGTNALDVDAPEAAAQGDEKGRNLLAEAVSEMWSAERELDAISPRRAVPYEKRAVRLLDKVFGGERLALRALAAPAIVLDPKRRLAGEAGDLHPAAVSEKPDEALAESAARLRGIASDLYRFCFSGAGSARSLADLVWNAPDFPGLDRAAAAAPLYAAKTAAESVAAARSAADRLVRLLEPAPITIAPPGEEPRAILDQLEFSAGGKPRAERG